MNAVRPVLNSASSLEFLAGEPDQVHDEASVTVYRTMTRLFCTTTGRLATTGGRRTIVVVDLTTAWAFSIPFVLLTAETGIADAAPVPTSMPMSETAETSERLRMKTS